VSLSPPVPPPRVAGLEQARPERPRLTASSKRECIIWPRYTRPHAAENGSA
jgi:hypothetical protein